MAPIPKKKLPPALRAVYVMSFKGKDFLEFNVITAKVINRSDNTSARVAY